MRVFGLTGNIGSGKSTVAAMLREAGIPVLDADRISREVTAPGGRAYDAVVHAFGGGILLDGGTIDRKRLGEIVFSDPAARERLERITHPAILEAMKEAIAGIEREGHRAAVVEATLIHESGKKGLFESVISVACDRETAISRLAARDGMSRGEAEARLRAQMDSDRKAGASDYVIDTSGDIESTRRQVVAMTRVLLEKGSPDRLPRVEERLPECLRHPLAGDVPSECVEPREKAIVRSQCAGDTLPRERQKIRQRGGDEPLRGSARHGGGHVRHAIVDDPFLNKIGGRVRRRAGRFDRPALVDGDIHHHRPGTHPAYRRPGHEERRPLPRHQHGGNDEVGSPDRIAYRFRGGPDRAHLSPAFTLGRCQFFRIHVEDRHVRADPGGDPRGVASGHPRSQHGHIPRRRSPGPWEQDAAPAAPLFQPPRSNLDGEDPRHLAHRPKDRQRAGGRHGLVGNGRYAAGQKLFRQPR